MELVFLIALLLLGGLVMAVWAIDRAIDGRGGYGTGAVLGTGYILSVAGGYMLGVFMDTFWIR